MFRYRSFVVLIALLPVMWLVSCSPSTDEVSGPQVGPVTPYGAPEIRDLDPTNEVVSNCGGVNDSVVKHPAVTVGSSHTVEWTIGGTTGVGVEIGSDLLPAKVNLNAALEGSVARDISSNIQQTNAWDLPAEPGYIMEYTLMWREVWQSGYIDATFADPEPEMFRIDVKYRTGIQSEIVGQNSTLCDPDSTAPATIPAPLASPTQQDTVSTLNHSDLDDLFGVDNWFCFPDRENGVGFHQLPQNFHVVSPLRYIDTYIGEFSVGQVAPGGTGGTAELVLTLPQSECPSYQQTALAEWLQNRASDSQPFTKERIDALFNSGNWSCLPDYHSGVKVFYLNSDIVVQYPLAAADSQSGKHGVGDIVPGKTEITAWFAGSISRSECP